MSAADPLFLTLDVGSQSARACLIDAQGDFHGKVSAPLKAPESQEPGQAETPVEHFWQVVVDCVSQLQSQHHDLWPRVSAIGLTTQRATVVTLDQHGAPLRPAILWSDQRRCQPPDTLGLTGLGMRILGVHQTVKRFQADAEINYLAEHEPQTLAQLHKLLFLSGYLNFRLTGAFVDSAANQVGYVPFDYRRQVWAAKGQWHWKALPAMRRSYLPELKPAGSTLGTLTPTSAHTLGLSSNLPVVACATDKACEVLATGCLTLNQACLSFGTAATVNVTSERYLEAERFVPAYPAACAGRYLSEVQTHRGFWLVEWFKREFAAEEERTAKALGVATETLFDEFLRQTAPGAGGLLAQPYWSPGVRVPGPEARGALIGFNDTHGKPHVYRALIEGLLFSLREGLEKIERGTGSRVADVRVAGGGSQSDEILQLCAHILGRTVARTQTFEASSLGVAMCAAVATGVYASFDRAVSFMSHAGDAFEPDVDTEKTYNHLYTQVYRPMYARLRPLYRQLTSRTGEST